jgi:diphthamide synthase (EF-2-diphthine--ammonia ligase)
MVNLPDPCSNSQYEAALKAVVGEALPDGVECMAFGDLFLRDVREYREAQLAGTGLTPLFPLWGLPTDELAREMVGGGLRAVVSCVDPRQLPAGFAGCEYDAAFLSELPAGVDPCGERGEFHTFAFDGPMFLRPIDVKVGEVVERGGFAYADILPASSQDVIR